MKRYTYPTFISCDAPDKAITLQDGSFKLPINIKKMCHYTYIDTHGKIAKRGTNPIFDEYEQLLDNSDDFRFLKSGIADDTESKVRESGKIARGMARYILSEYYGYTWFSKIQNLISKTENGWTAERPKKGGDTPDWLVSNGLKDYCLAEAKGTHNHINSSSPKVKTWIKQSTNIIIKKNNKAKN